MVEGVLGRPPDLLVRLRAQVLRSPSWWYWLVAASGWVLLAWSAWPRQQPAAMTGMHGHHLAHGATHQGGAGSVGGHVLMWTAMVAVMAPLLAPNARYVGLRSPAAHRTSATVVVLAGWLAVWAAAATAIGLSTALLLERLGAPVTVVIGFGVAAVWQLSPGKRSAATRCHRVVVPPLDPEAARAACRRLGCRVGVDCVGSCWALMAAMGAAHHALWAVVPLWWVSWYERQRRPHHDQRPAVTTAVIGVVGTVAWMLAA